MKLSILPNVFGICRLPAESALPSWLPNDGFVSVTRTEEELSIVCEQQLIPVDMEVEKNWQALRVDGSLDFNLTGILYSLTKPLAENNISIFAISTFNTDYILVKKHKLHDAVSALTTAGHSII